MQRDILIEIFDRLYMEIRTFNKFMGFRVRKPSKFYSNDILFTNVKLGQERDMLYDNGRQLLHTAQVTEPWQVSSVSITLTFKTSERVRNMVELDSLGI